MSLLLAGGVAPAHAATTQSLDAETGPQLPLVDPAIQAAAEAEVARFVTAHPEPEFIMGSGAEAFDRFLAELLDYYAKVPWDATILQWGCTVSQPVTWRKDVTSDGAPTVVSEGGFHCGGYELATHWAGVVRTKSSVLAETGSAGDEPVAGEVADGCGSGTNVRMCLSRPAVGRIRAEATFTGTGNAAAYIRLGQAASLNDCVWGPVIATGGDGVWIPGTSRYVDGAVQQNSNWTNSWMRDFGSGPVSQGTYCERI